MIVMYYLKIDFGIWAKSLKRLFFYKALFNEPLHLPLLANGAPRDILDK